MEKVLILANGQKYNLSPINNEEFTRCANISSRFFSSFKEKHGYVELTDFSPFLLKDSKIELRDGEYKFKIERGGNYEYVLDDQFNEKKCSCDGINEACSDCPKD